MTRSSVNKSKTQTKTAAAAPLRSVIYHQLVNDIVQGHVNAGERLSEAALVERFGVSKTPIREALIQMEREGYILLKKNVGAVVQKVSAKMVEEVFTIVAVLEAYATEVVVAERKLTKADVKHLAELISVMREKAERRQYLEYRSLNIKFHGFFIEKLGNETLKRKVVDLRKRTYGFVVGGLTLPMHIDRYVEYHKKILDAVVRNDAAKAARLMRDHLLESKDFMVAAMAQAAAPISSFHE